MCIRDSPHWRTDFTVAAAVTGTDLTLAEAVAHANDWLAAIEDAAT